MFDSVLTQENVPRSNLAGLGLMTALCGLLGVAAWLIPASRGAQTDVPVDVARDATQPPTPPPRPPPPGGGETAQPSATTPATPKPKRIRKVQPTEPTPTPEVPKEPEPEPAHAPVTGSEPGGVPGGVAGGVAGGQVGGVVGGTVGGVVGGTGSGVIPFGQGMTRPTQIAGTQPQYNAQAIAARVEGKVLVRCVITVEGTVRDCKVIKGVPMLDEITLAALRSSRFTPITYRGKPESVEYLFTFNFKLP